jgi:hypothetical protein
MTFYETFSSTIVRTGPTSEGIAPFLQGLRLKSKAVYDRIPTDKILLWGVMVVVWTASILLCLPVAAASKFSRRRSFPC